MTAVRRTASAASSLAGGAFWGLVRGAAWRLLPFLVPALLVGAYVLEAASGNQYFPTIGAVADATRTLWFGKGFSQNVVPSLSNFAVGYAVGLVAGAVVGVVLGEIRALRDIVWPVVSFALTLPPVVLLPLLILVMGIGPTVQRTVIAFAVFILAVVNTTDGVRSNDMAHRDLASAYRVGGLRRIFCIVVPGAIAHMLAAARVGLSVALLLMVVGEMLGASHGIGAAILLAQDEFSYSQLWSGVVLLALLGIIFNFVFVALENRLLRVLGLTTYTGGPN